MTTVDAMPRLIAGGREVDPAHAGVLRSSIDLVGDRAALEGRIAEDGYLFLPGLLDRAEVMEARREIVGRLAKENLLVEGTDPMDGVFRADKRSAWKPDLAVKNAPLAKVLYEGRMMEFFARFLGGEVRHFDYTWLRAISRGAGTHSHCDVVYMGRGTKKLYTAWTPLGDIDYEMGGLMILEGSNRNEKLKSTYGQYDVDSYCENRPHLHGWKHGGHLGTNPNQIRKSVGGRWLSGEYRMGDVLVFTMFTVHASQDNRTDRVRLSSDSRYQLMSEPADERWIGENPIAHGEAGKRGRIC